MDLLKREGPTGSNPRVPTHAVSSKQGARLMIRSATACAVVLGAMLLAHPAAAQQRLPTIPPEQYTEEQRKAAEEFLAARKVPVFGPFQRMMHSPPVMNLARSI